MMTSHRRGWFGESHRHYLASKGIATKRYFSHVADMRDKQINWSSEPVGTKESINRKINVLKNRHPEKFEEGKYPEAVEEIRKEYAEKRSQEISGFDKLNLPIEYRARDREQWNEKNKGEKFSEDALAAIGRDEVIEQIRVVRDRDGNVLQTEEVGGVELIKTDEPNVYYGNARSVFSRGELRFAKEVAREFPDKKVIITMGPWRSYAVSAGLNKDKDTINLDFYSAGPALGHTDLEDVRSQVKSYLRFNEEKENE